MYILSLAPYRTVYGTIYYTYVRGRKFVVKKSKVVIPIMVVVAILATWILKDHTDVPILHKVLITIGACIMSGGLGYILLKPDVQKVDPKPNPQQTNKKGSRK